MRAPSTAEVGLPEKGREWLGYLQNHRRRQGDRRELGYLDDIAEYKADRKTHRGRGLEGARVLEIGFGPRPYRLATLAAAGAEPVGIDMEAPLIRLTPQALLRIQRLNGSERMVKSLARYLLFDRSARRHLQRALAARYGARELRFGRLVLGDAADLQLAKGSLDLVVSEDVFEHIEKESLTRTLEGMHHWLADDGLALIRPNVFTGISGGHLAEWSVESVLDEPRRPRHSEPWEHLRSPRFEPNTHLNRLTLTDYRRVFAEAGFEVLEERPRHPRLGASLLTPEIRAALADWPEEELFSNQVLFVLRPS